MATDYPAVRPASYVSPLEAGEPFHFVSAYTIYPYDFKDSPTRYVDFQETYDMEVTTPSGEKFKETFNRFISSNSGLPPTSVTTTGTNNGINLTLQSGTYSVTYSFSFTYPLGSPKHYSATFIFAVVENHYPVKKMTVLDVINRLLDTAEPLCAVKNVDGTASYVKPPRFSFEYRNPENTPEGIEERALFNQTAPEFTFTRMTLRECLQEVGRFIHAEPRLRKGKISFDRYGSPTVATYKRNSDRAMQTFPNHPYSGKRYRQDINEACTQVESDTDNYVNRLDNEGGTVAESFRNGGISLRSNVVYTRLEDSENLYFPTNRPIMDISSFKWVDIEGLAGEAGARYDITPHIFEKNIYDTQLSSYSQVYPYSKAYGLYFTLGEKDIKGFFFKNDDWSGGVLANYAIVNILEQVTGKSLKDQLTKKYPLLCFELVYTPIYGGRMSHGKSSLNDMLKRPFTMNYNQSANVVETRYYGENMKGVAERLGNAEKAFDIDIRNVGNLPKIGQKWDDDYYISSVTGATFRDRVCVSVTLSKNFNRLSAYIGANSYKRIYEVSERMSQQRDMLYKDYLVITTKNDYGIVELRDCFISTNALLSVVNTFCQSENYWSEIVSAVTAQGFSKQFGPQTKVVLPVISSSFGNVMEYTWEYADNYSAGTSVTKQKNEGATGYFGTETVYGDFYGRMYYQQWELQARSLSPNIEEALALPIAFDDANAEFFAGTTNFGQNIYQIVRKDSRERLNQSYAIEFVTDMDGIIIGSALARNNPTIGGLTLPQNDEERVSLYVLPNPVNKFSNVPLDLTGAVKVYTYDGSSYGVNPAAQIQFGRGGVTRLVFRGVAAPAGDWKAWAIVSGKKTGKPYLEEDEDGKVTEATPVYGNEILIAQNGAFKTGATVGKFNIIPMHDIFEFMKSKN